MTKAKGRARIESRVVDKSEKPPPPGLPDTGDGRWGPDVILPTWSCIEGWEAQVIQKECRSEHNGQLVAFAVMLQVRPADTDEGWADVERIDCAHGFVHIDQYDRKGNQVKNEGAVPEKCRTDLDAALRWAIAYIWEVEERTTGWR